MRAQRASKPLERETVAVVVVTYNRADLLAGLLDGLARLERPADAVIVVDNASTDHTPEVLAASTLPGLQVIRSTTNAGGAGGFNTGVRAAYHQGFDRIWLMDDDVVPVPDSLTVLLAQDEPCLTTVREDTAGALVEKAATRFDLDHAWAIRPKRGMVETAYRTRAEMPERVEVENVAFEGFMMRREVIDRIGLPDASFFIFYDDVDYAVRARRAGYTIYAVRDAVLVRQLDFSQQHDLSSWKGYYMYRNLFAVHFRYGAGALVRAKPWLITAGVVGIAAMLGRRSQIRNVLRALRDARGMRAVPPATPPRKPVIGLAGFFGPGNYGDELFLEVFHQYLGGEFELRVLADRHQRPYYSRPVEEIVEEVDAILIGGGDILQQWATDPRYFNHAFLAKPCFVVGIGVPIYSGAGARPAVPRVMRRHRRFFHHPNLKRIGVRDEQARAWIEENLEPTVPVLVAPDIVCALDLPPATKPEGAPILGIATRYRPNLEEPDDYTRVAELARHAQAQGWRVRHVVLGTGEVGRRDLSNADDLEVPGKELLHSEDLTELTRAIGECTAFASMKFHGTVVATMYGVPSIVMIPTNKNGNFMARLGLEALVARFDSPRLIDIFDQRPTPDPEALARLRAAADAHLRDLVAAIRAEVRQTT